MTIQAAHGYFIAPHAHPEFVIVLSVSDRIVRFVEPREAMLPLHLDTDVFTAFARAGDAAAQERVDRWRAEPSVADDVRTHAARHGAPVTFADYDRVRAIVSWPEGTDGFGVARRVGAAGGWDDDARRCDVECARGDLAELVAHGLTVEQVDVVTACPTT